MSREIKFRIMYKNNIWFKDEYTLRDLIKMDGAGFLGDDDIIEQYTGLMDKNGKELCEGDIVNIGKYGIYVVVFDEFWCGFEFKGGKGIKTRSGVEHPRFSQDWQTAEVIGNIHENPELVGSEE